MLSHDKVWAAIDALAAQNGLSASALARRAGLDPTSFNRSKRFTGDGRPRWPSTESLSKVLEATGEALETFVARVEPVTAAGPRPGPLVPLIGLKDAAAARSFDLGGQPTGTTWTTFQFPVPDAGEFALRVSDNRFLPLYRRGDVIIVSHKAAIRSGDRLVVKPVDQPPSLFLLANQTPATLELATIGDNSKSLHYPPSAIEWRARIIWASQ